MRSPANGRKRAAVKAFSLVLLVILTFTGSAWCASGGGTGEHGEEKGWLATDTYRVLNFVVLAAALLFLFRKYGVPFLSSRISEIKEQLSELEKKKQDAEKELARYNDKLADLDKEAERILAEYEKQGNEAKARILEAAAAAAERVETQALRNIEHEFEEAKLRLQEEIAERALAQAEERISLNITPEDQNRLIDEYVEKVVAR